MGHAVLLHDCHCGGASRKIL